MDDRTRLQDTDTPNQASNKEKAEGSRDNAGSGISNRPLKQEEERQRELPPRGESKDGSHA